MFSTMVFSISDLWTKKTPLKVFVPVLDQEHISKYFDLVSYSTGLQVYWLCTLYETFYPLSPLLPETFFAVIAHHSSSHWLLHPNFWIFVSLKDFLSPLLHKHRLSQVFQNLLLVNLFWFPPHWQYSIHRYLHLKSYQVHQDLPLHQWRYIPENSSCNFSCSALVFRHFFAAVIFYILYLSKSIKKTLNTIINRKTKIKYLQIIFYTNQHATIFKPKNGIKIE